MKFGCMTAWGVLLATTLVAGSALGQGAVDPAHAELGPHIETPKADALGDDEAQALLKLPLTEQRRRLDAVLASYPHDLRALFLRTQVEYMLGDAAAVDADSRLVLADPSLDRRYRELVLEWRSQVLIDLWRFDEAIVVADEALEIDAARANPLFARGWARFFMNRSHEALTDLDRALEIEPNEGIGHYRRARVLRAEGKLELAAKDYERAIELEPDDGPSHRDYGILLYQTHDVERALVEFDAGVHLMPNDALALSWHAQANFARRHFDAATADDRRASELGITNEKLAHALTHVAADLQDQDDFAGAAREFEKALALQSDDYLALRLFLARGRANPVDEQAAGAQLTSWVKPHQPHAWTDTLVSMLLGRTTHEAALAEADAAESDLLKAGRRCEADYYAAEQMLMHQQVATASRLLEEAYWVCPATYAEADAVIAERRLLVARSSAR